MTAISKTSPFVDLFAMMKQIFHLDYQLAPKFLAPNDIPSRMEGLNNISKFLILICEDAPTPDFLLTHSWQYGAKFFI